jgi:hypothetical protein
VVQTRSQWEIGTPMATAPATARSTKPAGQREHVDDDVVLQRRRVRGEQHDVAHSGHRQLTVDGRGARHAHGRPGRAPRPAHAVESAPDAMGR